MSCSEKGSRGISRKVAEMRVVLDGPYDKINSDRAKPVDSEEFLETVRLHVSEPLSSARRGRCLSTLLSLIPEPARDITEIREFIAGDRSAA